MPVSSVISPKSWWRVSAPRGFHQDHSLSRAASRLGFSGLTFESCDLYFVSGCSDEVDAQRLAQSLISEPFGPQVAVTFVDPYEETATSSELVVEVARRAGVTDRVAFQMQESAARLGLDVRIATGSAHRILGADHLDDSAVTELVERILCNPVVEIWDRSRVNPGFVPTSSDGAHSHVETVALRGLSDVQLSQLNRQRGLALDHSELLVVQQWFATEGRDPTDAEIETIAQTWSEHCSHKTFTARITTTGGDEIAPLLRQLRDCTRTINAPFVVSAFDGNAGIVRFGDSHALAIKAETHNHPSAVEPFGGANTGVGGVVRDVLAAPAIPVALTDVLCFGPADTRPDQLPRGVLHPEMIREGVVAGVADYGNKIGVPTVAGAVLYDEGYIANPLVFCGCVGRVLRGYDAIGEPRVGDQIVVIGGATGRDGIKGATFSSMTVDASTGSVAGASVQIGDPIVERLVGEVLVDLLDREVPLCTSLTDCGAGGLSSAVGEMAEKLGATIDLALVERKYPGLAPWEIWLSEAQERMVLGVDPCDVPEVLHRCLVRGVKATVIGEFTGTRRLIVQHGSEIVVDMPTDFLFDGRPQREMIADLEPHPTLATTSRHVADHAQMVCQLLAHPNIASKEAVIRRYDHEILGATVIGPMSAPWQTGPSDGVVIVRPEDENGFALGIGVNARYGLYDCRSMAWSAVDEAMRNVVSVGADPSAVALLDNFSWGDPSRPSTLGDLVHAVDGCCAAALAFSAPFVSGKDSLNNEYESDSGVRQSIPPTLVITALAHVPDVDQCVSSTLSTIGSAIVMTGLTSDELRGSHLDLLLGSDHGGLVPQPDTTAPLRYRALYELIREGKIRSAHDCSEGGLAVALAEYCLTSPFGLDVDIRAVAATDVVALYAESNGRILLEVDPNLVDEVCERLGLAVLLGTVSEDPDLHCRTHDTQFCVSRTQMATAWSGEV